MVGGLRPEVDAYYEMELKRGGRPPPYAIIQVQHIQERASARALIPACADRCDPPAVPDVSRIVIRDDLFIDLPGARISWSVW